MADQQEDHKPTDPQSKDQNLTDQKGSDQEPKEVESAEHKPAEHKHVDKRTIEERLDRLTARQEAFMQALDGMSEIQKMTEELIKDLAEEVRHLTGAVRTMAADNQKLSADNQKRDRLIDEIAEGMARLLRRAEGQEEGKDKLKTAGSRRPASPRRASGG